MGTDTDLVLLERATTVLLEVAAFYVSDHKDAIRARKKVQQRVRSRHAAEQPPFHASVLSRLTALHGLLDSGLDKFDLTCLVPSDTIEITLDTCAELADDWVDSDHERYSALHGLVEAHDHDKLILGPRRLGHRMCLFCPSQDLQTRLQAQLVLCEEALAKTTGDRRSMMVSDSASIAVDTEDIEEWRSSIDITQAAETLHEVLSQHMPCHPYHEDNLARVSALPILERGLRKKLYTMCMRGEKSGSVWRAATLEPLNSKAHMRGVHFSPPERSDSATNEKAGVNVDVHTAMMCDMLYKPTVETSLRATTTAIHRQTDTVDHLPPQDLDLVTLGGCIGSPSIGGQKTLSKKERIEVAVVLSYTYLHLCETVWWPADHIQSDFWLMYAEGRINTNTPFLDACSRPSVAQSAYSPEWYMNDQRPSLPAFGKLLLEIWKGSAVDWKDLKSTVEDCNDDPIGTYWIYAVNACLGDEPTLRKAGSVRALGQIRSNYVNKVVKKLQWLLEKLCLTSVESLMARGPPTCNKPVPRRPDKSTTHAESSTYDHGSEHSETIAVSPRFSLPEHLINVRTMTLERSSDIPEDNTQYAILSHRWGRNEVLLEKWTREHERHGSSWAKIQGACRQARSDGFTYLWVDTCCIDKRSSAELNEAINSMFSYYENAAVCYVYLSDVSGTYQVADRDANLSSTTPQGRTIGRLRASEWFRRGWTLQELLAPSKVHFFDASWNLVGELKHMTRLVASITGIDAAALDRSRKLSSYSYAQRLSWASRRKTTRIEDEAYCLLGILGASLEVKYGIGRAAFIELQRKLLESGSGDDSLFLWSPLSKAVAQASTFFAPSPANFSHAGDIEPVQGRPVNSYFHLRSDGIGARVYLYHCEKHRHGWRGLVALMNCTKKSHSKMMVGLCLTATTDDSQATQFTVSCAEEAESPFLSTRYVSVSQQCLHLASPRDITIVIQPGMFGTS